jgi:hypothetical protein
VDKSCKDVQSNYLETLYSEHIALKQHIHSQVRAFVKGRAVHMDDPWKVLCISTTNCMNVARTVEEWVTRNLTDLEASYFVIEIHNALARFTNGLCNKGMIACQSVSLITTNDLQIFLTSIKTKRSDENLKETNAGDRFSVEMSNNNHVRSQRKKRWVFTNFLAAITGLANEDEVQKLDKAAENLGHVELNNAGEIVKLEGKSNEIISRIGKQSEQLAKLYHDEGILNDKLSHLLKEDVSINRQLASLVRALEAVSDVGIEYTVIGSIIELIPILINDCRVLVHSLYDGVLPTDVLNIVWKTGKHSHSSLKAVNSE